MQQERAGHPHPFRYAQFEIPRLALGLTEYCHPEHAKDLVDKKKV